MTDIPQSGLGLSSVELLLHQQRYDEALAALAKLIEENPSNRQIRIYRLLAVRIILLRQTLTQSIPPTVMPPRAMVQRRFSEPPNALQTLVMPDATYRLRWVRQPIRALFADDILSRAALALMGLALLIMRITSHIMHRLRWARPTIRAGMPGEILRSSGLVAAAVALLVTPITFCLSGSLAVPKQGMSNVQKESFEPPVQNNVEAIEASESRPQALRSAVDQQRFYNTVVNQLSNVRGVYGRWIENNRNLMGSLLLKLTVDSSGAVTQVDDLGSSLTDANFVNAIMNEARKWKFPENDAETAEIIIPLLLVPDGMDPEMLETWERTTIPRAQKDQKTSMLPVIDASSDSGTDRLVIKPKQHASDSRPHDRKQAAWQKSQKPQFAKEAATVYKTRHSLPLREGPRFTAASLQQIDGGTPISILDSQGDWLKVRTQHSSAVGYLRKEFVIPANIIR